jgi:glutamate synthase domain-containing protein 1
VCGIVGFLDKRAGVERPVGHVLLDMLRALSCRGPDSAGVAVLGPAGAGLVRLSAPSSSAPEAVATALRRLGLNPVRQYASGITDALVPAGLELRGVEPLVTGGLPGAEVICLGTRLSLFKQVGSPEQLEATYAIGALPGSHGIGHTRLSTESRVDLSHSQPFWAHGVPDLATVHNGHITNYHKLRRRYEQRGYRFYTENDSEVIGVYLRDRLAAGLTLEDALRSSLDDFDGSFSYLAAWPDGLAYVRDRFGFKPLVVAETEEFVAVATEEIALRRALGSDFAAREPPPGKVRVWAAPAAPVAAAR